MNAAVIGTRVPTDKQVKYLQEFIAGLDAGTTVISGCAKGIDTKALQFAKKRGLFTKCFVPFARKFGFADEVIVLSSLPTALRQEAYESVKKYHPAKGGGKISSVFHARNYLIVYKADFVLAVPNTTKKSFGGTGQGIRIAYGLGIPIRVIDEDGKEITDALSRM